LPVSARELDFAEKFGSSVEAEASELFESVMASSLLDEVSSKFVDFLGWWYRKTKAYRRFLNMIFSLPPGATILKEDTVSFVLRRPNEPPRIITVRRSAYDLVEMITLNKILRDENTRKELIDLLVELIKNGPVKLPDGKVYTTKEYVEKVLKMDWAEFEKKLRGKIEADINVYLREIDNTEGNPLAKHIWLRENSLRGDSSPWLFLFSQISTMSLLSLHTIVYVARNMWFLKYISFNDYRRATLKYYAYVGRFETVVDTLTREVFHDISTVTEKTLGERLIDVFRGKPYNYRDITEVAKNDFNELKDIFTRVTNSIPRKLLPSEIVAQLFDSRVSLRFVESIGKSRMKAEDEEKVSINA